jgi:hypothetical protein
VPTFADRGVPRGQRYGSLLPYSRYSRPGPLVFFFLPKSSSVVLTRLSEPRSGSSGSAGYRTWTSGSVARNSDN